MEEQQAKIEKDQNKLKPDYLAVESSKSKYESHENSEKNCDTSQQFECEGPMIYVPSSPTSVRRRLRYDNSAQQPMPQRSFTAAQKREMSRRVDLQLKLLKQSAIRRRASVEQQNKENEMGSEEHSS